MSENPVPNGADHPSSAAQGPVSRAEASLRVHRFAALRACQRALTPSLPDAVARIESDLGTSLRERLRDFASRFEGECTELPDQRGELEAIDRALVGYRDALLSCFEGLPLSQLRASLSSETHPQRVEVTALLRLSMEAEPLPKRFLRQVDFLLTLLCASLRDGHWVMELDPVEISDLVQERGQQGQDLSDEERDRVASRFDDAIERFKKAQDGTAITRQTSAYKAEIARHFFVPEILRAIVRYNVAARNHWEECARRGREVDAQIDDELGLFAPLLGEDPRAGKLGEAGLPAGEAPGVLAVERALCARLSGEQVVRASHEVSAAERVAASLDLASLAPSEREALLGETSGEVGLLIRTTVVLGHMAMVAPRQGRDLTELGIHESQLDAWLQQLATDVRREVDTHVGDSDLEGAVRLGDIQSRFLSAVRVAVKRRPGTGQKVEAIRAMRAQLERKRIDEDPALFMDLFGGGWRRSVALGLALGALALNCLVAWWPAADARRVAQVSPAAARALSPVLSGGYRDRAADSIFVGRLSSRWDSEPAAMRVSHAQIIQERLATRGVEEILLVDSQNVLQAHWRGGRWTAVRGW